MPINELLGISEWSAPQAYIFGAVVFIIAVLVLILVWWRISGTLNKMIESRDTAERNQANERQRFSDVLKEQAIAMKDVSNAIKQETERGVEQVKATAASAAAIAAIVENIGSVEQKADETLSRAAALQASTDAANAALKQLTSSIDDKYSALVELLQRRLDDLQNKLESCADVRGDLQRLHDDLVKQLHDIQRPALGATIPYVILKQPEKQI